MYPHMYIPHRTIFIQNIEIHTHTHIHIHTKVCKNNHDQNKAWLASGILEYPCLGYVALKHM